MRPPVYHWYFITFSLLYGMEAAEALLTCRNLLRSLEVFQYPCKRTVSAIPWSHEDLCRSKLDKDFKKKMIEIGEAEKMSWENSVLKIASSILQLLNTLRSFNTMTFSAAVLVSTDFSFLNSKNHRPCQFLCYSQSDTAPLETEFS